MIVSLIVAMDLGRGIGAGNQVPWRLPADLRRFRELTMGHHLLIGRKTYESIGRPLPGRVMIVVTRDAGYAAPDCLLAHSVAAALDERGGEAKFTLSLTVDTGSESPVTLPIIVTFARCNSGRIALTICLRCEGSTFELVSSRVVLASGERNAA